MSSDIVGSVFWPIHGSIAAAGEGANGSAAFASVHNILKGILGGSVGPVPTA